MAGLQNLPLQRKIIGVSSLVVLGLTPSYIDWQEHPEKRFQIVAFYSLAIWMFWYGLLE